ncbi:hypothetical protein OG801_24940 [Nocardioides sp. NBC_00163]|uniref:hypothetical protein n=1 Tax=Nocardioides sp. NBC_00163 TaxID=2975999 RepID=UPI00324EA07E
MALTRPFHRQNQQAAENLPSVGLSTDQLTWGAVITGIALLAVILVGAVLGAAGGQRYHTKIDRAVYDD